MTSFGVLDDYTIEKVSVDNGVEMRNFRHG